MQLVSVARRRNNSVTHGRLQRLGSLRVDGGDVNQRADEVVQLTRGIATARPSGTWNYSKLAGSSSIGARAAYTQPDVVDRRSVQPAARTIPAVTCVMVHCRPDCSWDQAGRRCGRIDVGGRGWWPVNDGDLLVRGRRQHGPLLAQRAAPDRRCVGPGGRRQVDAGAAAPSTCGGRVAWTADRRHTATVNQKLLALRRLHAPIMRRRRPATLLQRTVCHKER